MRINFFIGFFLFLILFVGAAFYFGGAWSLGFAGFVSGQQEVNADLDIIASNKEADLSSNVESAKVTESNTAFSKKLAKELELNERAAAQGVIFSSRNVYEKLMQRGARIDKDLADRMMADTVTVEDWRVIGILISETLTAEESFKVELSQYSSFQELKRVCDDRQRLTGSFCGDELLQQEVTYKDATANDILDVLKAGAVLPENAALLMMRANKLGMISDLQREGYAINVNYVDPYRGQNLLEAYIESYSIYDDGKAIETIDQLLQLGVPLSVNDGTRDPLDYVLANITPENSASRFSVAKKLINSGASFGASHSELLLHLKETHPELLSQFIE